jgi:hypothetical protein
LSSLYALSKTISWCATYCEKLDNSFIDTIDGVTAIFCLFILKSFNMLFKALHVTVIFFGYLVVEHELHSLFNVSNT